MNKIPTVSSKWTFADMFGGVIGGIGIWRALVGRKVTSSIDGKVKTYYIQPLSAKEIKGRMFEPITPKKRFNFFALMNNLKNTPRRAPIYCTLFAISLTHLVGTRIYKAHQDSERK